MRRFILGVLFILCFSSLSAADIAVVTIASGKAYKESVQIGTKSKEDYCKKHGYDFIFSDQITDPSRHIYWSKIILMLNTMQASSYKWVVWMDADTIIMNQDVPLEDLIDEDYNFLIAEDWNGINAGIFFIRNGEWGEEFLRNVYSRTDCLALDWPEQIAIARVIAENPEFGSLSKVVPQRLFNAYCKEITTSITSMYEPGDFLIHFASIRKPAKLKKFFAQYNIEVTNNRHLITLDRYLSYYGFKLSPSHSETNEGYMSNEQKNQYKKRLSLYPNIETILEIGLNAGHSANHFMRTCKNLKEFVSFDINQHAYTSVAAEYLKRTFKDKFLLIEGDSAVTVPQYSATYPDKIFDLIYVDGYHTYDYVIKDVMNCRALADSNTILWIDDYHSFVKEAVASLVDQGVLEIIHEEQSWGNHGFRSWVEARYLFD